MELTANRFILAKIRACCRSRSTFLPSAALYRNIDIPALSMIRLFDDPALPIG